MELALVGGRRETAKPKLAGTCPVCGQPVIAKCGTKIIWHWAHHGRKHCDPWWENETDWHRAWKSHFPIDWREQIHFDATGEKHVADVKTPSGTVLEFQHSPMSPQELQSREKFYGDMLWIVDGAPFVDQFFLLSRLPSPNADWTSDVVFGQQKRESHGGLFWRHSENPGYKPGQMALIYSTRDLQQDIDRDYIGHHLYDWVRPRSVWFESSVPVYIDFGGDLIWQMQRYDTRGLQCVQAIGKQTLIQQYGGDYLETGEVVWTAKRPRRNGDTVDRGENDVLIHLIR